MFTKITHALCSCGAKNRRDRIRSSPFFFNERLFQIELFQFAMLRHKNS